MPIKVLTLHQPWATLIALGIKQYETRDWATAYRGTVVIHAGKTFVPDERLRELLVNAGITKGEMLPLGAAVCVADLTAIYRTAELLPHLTPTEKKCGNFAPGRSAWRLENIRVLTPPIPARGQRGLQDWTLPLPEGVI